MTEDKPEEKFKKLDNGKWQCTDCGKVSYPPENWSHCCEKYLKR